MIKPLKMRPSYANFMMHFLKWQTDPRNFLNTISCTMQISKPICCSQSSIYPLCTPPQWVSGTVTQLRLYLSKSSIRQSIESSLLSTMPVRWHDNWLLLFSDCWHFTCSGVIHIVQSSNLYTTKLTETFHAWYRSVISPKAHKW